MGEVKLWQQPGMTAEQVYEALCEWAGTQPKGEDESRILAAFRIVERNARVRALEEAAGVCEERADGWRGTDPFAQAVILHDEGKALASTIRALIAGAGEGE